MSDVLHLLFLVKNDYYAITAKNIIKVCPYLPLQKLIGIEDYILGVFRYRTQMVPVIDMAKLFYQTYSSLRMGTRILVVEWTDKEESFPIGIMVDSILDTFRLQKKNIIKHYVHSDQKILGNFAHSDGHDAQIVTIKDIIQPELRKRIYAKVAKSNSE